MEGERGREEHILSRHETPYVTFAFYLLIF